MRKKQSAWVSYMNALSDFPHSTDYRPTLAALVIMGHITPAEADVITADPQFLAGLAPASGSHLAADLTAAIERARGGRVPPPSAIDYQAIADELRATIEPPRGDMQLGDYYAALALQNFADAVERVGRRRQEAPVGHP